MERNNVLHFLPASGGDFFWMQYGAEASPANVIIDTGLQNNWPALNGIMRQIKEGHQRVDALLLTHIDDDHIGGFFQWLKTNPDIDLIKRIWFNTEKGLAKKLQAEKFTKPDSRLQASSNANENHSRDYSAASASSMLDLLNKMAFVELKTDTLSGDTVDDLPYGATIRFISPSSETALGFINYWSGATALPKDYAAESQALEDLSVLQSYSEPSDTSPTNGSSLAFLFDVGETHIAFLGDAFANVCVEGLKRFGYAESNPYTASMIKLSHHGSARNLSDDLLQYIAGEKFLLSSSSARISRTQKITIAKLLNFREHVSVYTNFSVPKSFFTKSDQIDYCDTKRLEVINISEQEGGHSVELDGHLLLTGK